MSREVEAAARLGVDVVQIDDGWQRGVTANSAQAKEKGGVWNGFWASDDRFWDVNLDRFPEGIDGLVAAAALHGMKFGLWFAPDSSNESQNWKLDAEAILRLHRELDINFFKIDALKLKTRLGEERVRDFFEYVLQESHGAVTFDQDITAEDRFGPFGLLDPGPLFVENRYTDWHRYWPHHTLRVGWQLTRWIDPVRLRLEWLNNQRHQDKYAGDPLAPANWRPDALFATVLPFAPLGWFEVQNLPEAYFQQAAPLIATWKQHRHALHRSEMTPIGTAPDGVSWTGFFWKSAEAEYALAFRELNASSAWQVTVPGVACGSGEVLGGRGRATLGGGLLEVNVPAELDFVWVRWEV
jgi:alpha-galactosidase